MRKEFYLHIDTLSTKILETLTPSVCEEAILPLRHSRWLLLLVFTELHAYSFAYTVRLHRYTEECFSNAHRAFGMRNNDKLGIRLEFANDKIKSLIVCFVQSRINFVQQTEGGRLGFENRKQQGDSGHCFFSAAQKRYAS